MSGKSPLIIVKLLSSKTKDRILATSAAFLNACHPASQDYSSAKRRAKNTLIEHGRSLIFLSDFIMLNCMSATDVLYMRVSPSASGNFQNHSYYAQQKPGQGRLHHDTKYLLSANIRSILNKQDDLLSLINLTILTQTINGHIITALVSTINT